MMELKSEEKKPTDNTKKGVTRIICGSVLLVLQLLSTIGGIRAGSLYTPSPPSTVLQLVYDMIVCASSNWAGILGAILLISGLLAYRKSKEAVACGHSVPTVETPDNVPAEPADEAPAETFAVEIVQEPEVVQPSAPSRTKARYCKHCGSPIDPTTRQCTGCGKQYFRLPIIKGQHIAILLAALLCTTASLALVAQRTNYEAQIADLNTQIAELKNINNERVDTYNDLQRELSAKENLVESLNGRIDALNEEIDYYDEHVAFVPNDSSGLYHTYDCWRWSWNRTRYYQILSVEAAQERGFTPCPKCCD